MEEGQQRQGALFFGYVAAMNALVVATLTINRLAALAGDPKPHQSTLATLRTYLEQPQTLQDADPRLAEDLVKGLLDATQAAALAAPGSTAEDVLAEFQTMTELLRGQGGRSA